MSSLARAKAAARKRAERRAGNLAAARRLRFELSTAALERFAGGRSLTVLDAGCGEGLLTESLARRHPRWTILGVDLDDEQLGKARRRLQARSNASFVRGDLTGDLGEARYDAVVAIECLEEIPDDDAALAAMARALRGGGLLLAHVPERDWRPALRRSAATWKNEVRHGYDRDGLRAKLESVGLEVDSVTPTSRTVVRVAQELRDRTRDRSLKVALLVYPLATAAVRLERWGLTWGSPRALFAQARKR